MGASRRCFEGLVLDDALRLAWTDSGAMVRLTRTERALLARLLANPGQILSRDQLLDALGTADHDPFDRNIDYVVHRLRHKLGDKARRPRFIETQYGEGYVWIGRPVADMPGDVFMVVGPVPIGQKLAEDEQDLMQALADSLAAAFGPSQDVVLRSHWRAEEEGSSPSYAVDVDFYRADDGLHVALVLRSTQVLQTLRLTFRPGEPVTAALHRAATDIHSAVWAALAAPSLSQLASNAAPLEVRMVAASVMLAPDEESWLQTLTQLRRARLTQPDAPELAIMEGLNLLCQVITGGDDCNNSVAEWHQHDDTMERLALGNYPQVVSNPLLSLGAARLLHFVNRGHDALAGQLAQRALEVSTAFSAALVTRGIFRMGQGEIDAALADYDRALVGAAPGALFWRFVTTLRCTALLAAGRRRQLDVASAQLFAASPRLLPAVGMFMLDPEQPKRPPEIDAVLRAITLPLARRAVRYLYFASARHFVDPSQRVAIMAGTLQLLGERFSGPELVAELPAGWGGEAETLQSA